MSRARQKIRGVHDFVKERKLLDQDRTDRKHGCRDLLRDAYPGCLACRPRSRIMDGLPGLRADANARDFLRISRLRLAVETKARTTGIGRIGTAMRYRVFSAIKPHDACTQTVFIHEFVSLNAALEAAIRGVDDCKHGKVPDQNFCIKTEDHTIVMGSQAIREAYEKKMKHLPYK